MLQLQTQLKERREKANAAVRKAQELRDALLKQEADPSKWPAEKNQEFDRHMGEFKEHHAEVQRLEKEIERLSVDAHVRHYSEPATGVPVRGTDTRTSQPARPNMEALKRWFDTPEHMRRFIPREEQESAALAHRDAFNRYIRYGTEGLSPDEVRLCYSKPIEQHAHSSLVGSLGGFLAPADYRAEIVRDLPTFTTMRPICRVYPTGSDTLQLPSIASATGGNANKYSSGYTGSWRGQNYITGGTAPTVQNQPSFGLESIPVGIWQPDAIELPIVLIEDSKADVEGIIREIIAETWGLDEDVAFTNGDGTLGRPRGIRQSGLTTINSGDASLLKYNGLVDVFTGLPSQYRKNAKWMQNSSTYGAMLKLADSQNRPLFPIGAPVDKLFDKELAMNEFMPDVSANAEPVCFGDFRYYGIADRMELRIQRLTERFVPNIGILPMARVGGQVLRTNAFRMQKIAA